jgi:hypothetical protein
MSKRLGTKAETMVMAWPFFRRGCGANGGIGSFTERLYFTKRAQTSPTDPQERFGRGSIEDLGQPLLGGYSRVHGGSIRIHRVLLLRKETRIHLKYGFPYT